MDIDKFELPGCRPRYNPKLVRAPVATIRLGFAGDLTLRARKFPRGLCHDGNRTRLIR